MNELNVVGSTGMLPYREYEGSKVFTFQDIADGLEVGASAIRRQFNRNLEAWNPVSSQNSQQEEI
jgi:hypothetical protein